MPITSNHKLRKRRIFSIYLWPSTFSMPVISILFMGMKKEKIGWYINKRTMMVRYRSPDYFDLKYVSNIVFALIYTERQTFVFKIQAHRCSVLEKWIFLTIFTIYWQSSHLVWCLKPICNNIIQAPFFLSYFRFWFF